MLRRISRSGGYGGDNAPFALVLAAMRADVEPLAPWTLVGVELGLYALVHQLGHLDSLGHRSIADLASALAFDNGIT